jgi:hypothetical protein
MQLGIMINVVCVEDLYTEILVVMNRPDFETIAICLE